VDGKVDYTKVVTCECVREEREEARRLAMIRFCELPPKGREMTFENFERTPALCEAYNACLDLAEGRRGHRWITLMGDTGLGKTHLGISVCNRWLADGKPAKYANVTLFLDELRAAFGKDGDSSYQSRYHVFLNVPLLMLDDLGTENPTPWAQEHLYELLDYRLMHELPTVITTNVPLSEINFRILARLKRDGDIIYIDAAEYKRKEVKR
jgi:DNA replication protein DnaC